MQTQRIRLLIFAFLVIVVCCSLIGYRHARPDRRAIRQHVSIVRPVSRIYFEVREDTLAELKRVQTVWQRWAEYPPCRFNTKPTDWESGQVPIAIVLPSENAAIRGAIKEAWNNLTDRVKWCFGTAEFISAAQQKSADGLTMDAAMLPIRDNWMNQIAFNNLHSVQADPVTGSISDYQRKNPQVHIINYAGGLLIDDF